MDFTSPNRILNFHGQCKEKVIWGAGSAEQSIVQLTDLALLELLGVEDAVI